MRGTAVTVIVAVILAIVAEVAIIVRIVGQPEVASYSRVNVGGTECIVARTHRTVALSCDWTRQP